MLLLVVFLSFLVIFGPKPAVTLGLRVIGPEGEKTTKTIKPLKGQKTGLVLDQKITLKPYLT